MRADGGGGNNYVDIPDESPRREPACATVWYARACVIHARVRPSVRFVLRRRRRHSDAKVARSASDANEAASVGVPLLSLASALLRITELRCGEK